VQDDPVEEATRPYADEDRRHSNPVAVPAASVPMFIDEPCRA